MAVSDGVSASISIDEHVPLKCLVTKRLWAVSCLLTAGGVTKVLARAISTVGCYNHNEKYVFFIFCFLSFVQITSLTECCGGANICCDKCHLMYC